VFPYKILERSILSPSVTYVVLSDNQ
jgi:hypothetical protein